MTHFVVSCEHGGNRIPRPYQHFFHEFESLRLSHRGYDCGALCMAREMALKLDASLFVSTTSRLLIDLNRSIGHPHLFSEVTRSMPKIIRREILARYYLPYRNQVEMAIAEMIRQGSRVIHISSHSFTPELDGQVRNADIGLLYDSSRANERALCHRWQAGFKAKEPGFTIRRNYPYTGTADGFTTYLRRRLPTDVYAGIELEINQKHILGGGSKWPALRHALLEALYKVAV